MRMMSSQGMKKVNESSKWEIVHAIFDYLMYMLFILTTVGFLMLAVKHIVGR